MPKTVNKSMTALERQKNFGGFYTPEPVAEFLVEWAIRSKKDNIMDPGTGEGVFMRKSIDRLTKLGNKKSAIGNRVFGIEYESEAYKFLKENFSGFSVINSNFFEITPSSKPDYATTLPFVDAVVGNPPYIERERMKSVERIQKIIMSNYELESKLHTVTDIYAYFLIHSTGFLKEGGRLAVIVSDSWLNMDYGIALKEFLLKNYKIKAIVGFEERVFSNALVRAVLILAEKSNLSGDNNVQFIKLQNHGELGKLKPLLSNGLIDKNSVKLTEIKQSQLNPKESWGVYLKASKSYFDIISKSLVVPLREIANVGIGLQSLKNDFYIVDEQKVKTLSLENQLLDKIVVSPRNCPLIIDDRKAIHDHVIYCNKDIDEIKDTNLARYIKNAEVADVYQRGKNKKFSGYQNIPRINQARRQPWYNLIPEIEKRCRGSIVLPRRSFTRFFASWNKIKTVINDNFINIEPHEPTHIIPLLAVLNSSFTEYLCRVRAQTYGGGVYDLRPDDVKNLPTLNLRLVSNAHRKKLAAAYERFVQSGGIDRAEIDKVIMRDILQLRRKNFDELTKEQDSLRLLAVVSNGRTKK